MKSTKSAVASKSTKKSNKLDSKDDIPLLEEHIHDLDFDMQSIAYQSAEDLEKLGWTPKDNTDEILYNIARNNWKELKRIGQSAIDFLRDKSKDKDPKVRLTIAFILKQFYFDSTEDILIGLLKDKDKDVRTLAVGALRHYRKDLAYDHLIKFLKDKDLDVVIMSVEVLSESGYIEAVTILHELLKALLVKSDITKKQEELAETIVYSFGYLKGAIASETLMGLLKEERHPFETAAIFSLGQIREKRAVPLLIEAYKRYRPLPSFLRIGVFSLIFVFRISHDLLKRKYIVDALGQIGSSDGIGILIEALADDEVQVKCAAYKALKNFSDNNAIEALHQVTWVGLDKSEKKKLRRDKEGHDRAFENMKLAAPFIFLLCVIPLFIRKLYPSIYQVYFGNFPRTIFVLPVLLVIVILFYLVYKAQKLADLVEIQEILKDGKKTDPK